ncbi:hypothetical protein [Nonomuraea sp. NPDC005650]|uniref:hypothetical protein n=1 Tax=Nonomuraea sp. NPDC005650 TaxID=3157045 RepID=UPI0033BE1BB9
MNPFRDDAYSQLPLTGSHEVGVGHALITLVEPHPGHESHYNRWYEDTHYFDGAMQMPWMFAGRRWLAPYWLQPLRYPAGTPVLPSVETGKYLGTYWITKGRLDDHRNWTGATNARHRAIGNVVTDRTTVYTAFHDSVGNVYRDPAVPRARYALQDPAAGIVLHVIDAHTTEGREDLERWLLEEYLPSRVVADGPVSLAMVFRVLPPLEYYHSKQNYEVLKGVSNDERRLTLLWFLTEDPREIWAEHFTHEVDNLATSGKGVTSLIAPFIPAKMGTSLYEDQLRGPVGSNG